MRLTVEGLACRRGGRRVFRAVGFSLGPGEALVVTGRNGAGKSTLLAALAGLVRPDAGRIALNGAADAPPGEFVHLVAHRDALKPSLTAAENLRVWAALLGRPRLSPGDALARLGLAGAAELPASALSAGQRRRAALARLLVAERPLWLLDEPTTALDAAGQVLLGRIMRDHLAAGGLIVAATHAPLDLDRAATLALDGGTAVLVGAGRTSPGREAAP